jgi:aminoglycoside 3-N-acetyltransferase
MPRAQGLRAVAKRLRGRYRKARLMAVRRLFSYGRTDLVDSLRAVGVGPGDSVLVHAAFDQSHGFRGTVADANEAFLEAVGPAGNLLMVSLPYRSSSFDYLSRTASVDIRKVPSMMGLMSEFFRRRRDVLRSAHPTHPMLVHGPDAAWFVEGHERCAYPCGPGTPFEKLLDVGGKVVFFNVPFGNFTFFHYLEHKVRDQLDFPIYAERPFDVEVIDARGGRNVVRTFAFSKDAIRRRRPAMLEAWLRERNLIRTKRVGTSKLLLVDVREVTALVDEMSARGRHFYVEDGDSG